MHVADLVFEPLCGQAEVAAPAPAGGDEVEEVVLEVDGEVIPTAVLPDPVPLD